jgi:hypothetical protein
MAIRRLPVIERDPLERPATVGDCRGGVRPCPWLSCRFNLLVDVLEDGNLVLNARSKRLSGADRPIPNDHEPARAWFVEIRIPARHAPHRDPGRPAIFALGPLDSHPRAKAIAAAWEAQHGDNTTRVHSELPGAYQRVGPAREGAIDAKFNDEAEDAVEQWFDEPDPAMPSCVIDEVSKLDRDSDDHLLEQIAKIMLVSRERVRQVEVAALGKLQRGGLNLRDILDED